MRHIVLLAFCLLTVACVAVTGTDWQTRIGHFSLNDARRELGAPESCIGLDDGGSVCSWRASSGKKEMDKLVLTFDQNGQLATANAVQF